MSGRYIRPGIMARLLVVLLIQAGVLGWMVFERARLLETGTEALLTVVPVDPRDFFRGDYVTLAYDISTVHPSALGGDADFRTNDEIWVVLDTPPDMPATLRAVFRDKPAEMPDTVTLHGRVFAAFDGRPAMDDGTECPDPCSTLRVRYGIEQYFVPEGEGRELENLRNDMRVEIVAAVGNDGKAAIKRLLVDGIERYDEPLY